MGSLNDILDCDYLSTTLGFPQGALCRGNRLEDFEMCYQGGACTCSLACSFTDRKATW